MSMLAIENTYKAGVNRGRWLQRLRNSNVDGGRATGCRRVAVERLSAPVRCHQGAATIEPSSYVVPRLCLNPKQSG